MIQEVDNYIDVGCGRCSLVGTPQCKVKTWTEELVLLREILNETELNEELKWSMPCYTINGKNVLILSAFKEFCSLNFFKGVLMKDKHSMLEKAGENSHAARLMKFTSPEQVTQNRAIIKAYILEAIEIEKKGLSADSVPKKELELPEELLEKFEESPEFKEAFYKLTPGRQKGYILYFSGAKQSATRISRIEKYVDAIMNGKGFHDR